MCARGMFFNHNSHIGHIGRQPALLFTTHLSLFTIPAFCIPALFFCMLAGARFQTRDLGFGIMVIFIIHFKLG
jgi:hypothetical protein